ncbi:MAG TPA: saccharopine dehydrogenase NADP-binding domain-containing protein [Polyangiaceae bacterium]|jgi:short subunit dehydrogenase-like uncharacterized protein|nr:saccharopine dehydrogenase NADP-binding domain-containing protein [Polyangiaceae bacterium]
MTQADLLVYGANGFTGALVVERAHAMGLRPVVAGRSRETIEPLAKRFGLPFRVFDLADEARVREGVRGARVVLHCAGPYSKTSRPMLDACLKEHVHYLDITGEYLVLEAVLARDAEARANGVVAIPAVGFDVVPTDCMAASLAAALPGAVRLELAFGGEMAPSPGTAKTTVENLHVGALVRQEGAIVALPAPRTREIPFASGARFAMSIPWGDLVTAHHSTGIPNITVYMVIPKLAARVVGLMRFGAPLLRRPSVIGFLQREVAMRAKGPTAEARLRCRMSIWGRAEDANGGAVEGQLEVPDGYELTVVAALASAGRVLGGEVKPGATTPSKAFGADFVTGLPGVGPLSLRRVS